MAPTALLVHIKGKQIERFLATHEFLADARAPPKKRRCAPKSALTCAVGCDAFLAPWEFKPRTYQNVSEWRSQAPPPHCVGPQAAARFCRVAHRPAGDLDKAAVPLRQPDGTLQWAPGDAWRTGIFGKVMTPLGPWTRHANATAPAELPTAAEPCSEDGPRLGAAIDIMYRAYDRKAVPLLQRAHATVAAARERAVAAGVPEKLLPNAARLAKLQEDALKPPKPPKAKSKGRGRPTRMFG